MNAENRADKDPVSKQPDYHELAVKNRARVDKWLTESSIAPEWQAYNKFMADTPKETRKRFSEGEWPEGTPQIVIDLYTKTTKYEKLFKDTLGNYPSVEDVLARTPEDVMRLEQEGQKKELDHKILREKVLDVLESLTARERRVLRLRFGIEDGRGHKVREVSKELGFSESTIRRDQKRALEKLRKKSGKKLRDYLE